MEKSLSKFELIKRQIENYQNLRKNLSCVENCGCDASVLVGKLMTILEGNEEEKEEKKAKPSSGPESVQISQEVQATPEQKALSNSIVMRIILSWMNARDLLEFRQVSKLWREEATSILLLRHAEFFCVKFTKLENFDFTHNAGTLSLFLDECLSHANIFPCSHFVFNRGRLSDPNLLLFFSKYGKVVEHLSLNPEVVDLNILQHLLMNWTPNLKSLTFQPTSWAGGRHLGRKRKEILLNWH